MFKIAYLYNQNNEFIGEVNAQLDPLEFKLNNKVKYILPPMATFEPIIAEKNGFIRKFDGKEWFYEELPKPEVIPEYIPTYVDLRIAEYPSIGDQLDMIYWDKINNTNNWVDKITEIKAKYPKE